GRGVGLDVVRTIINDIGGDLGATSVDGKGTTWTMSFPIPRTLTEAHIVRVPDVPMAIAIETGWQLVDATDEAIAVDLAGLFGIGEASTGPAVTFAKPGRRPIALRVDQIAGRAIVRRVIATHPSELCEIVLLDANEALLVRLDHLAESP